MVDINIIDELHQDLKHVIFGFVDESTAARAAAVSTLWRDDWKSRPNLSFEQVDFVSENFREHVVGLFRRYSAENTRLASLRLICADGPTEPDNYVPDHLLSEWLIESAVHLGVGELTIKIGVLDFGIADVQNVRSYLPKCVLESNGIKSLMLSKVLVTFGPEQPIGCLNLTCLHLSEVVLLGEVFGDLIRKCPNLEKLSLEMVICSDKEKINSPRTLDSLDLVTVPDDWVYNLKIQELRLVDLNIGAHIYKHCMWSKFSHLKKLDVRDINSEYNWMGVKINSPSLERIALRLFNSEAEISFDVPNIKVFYVVGRHLVNITGFKGGEKLVSPCIKTGCKNLTAKWLEKLKTVIGKLGTSPRVSIYLENDGIVDIDQDMDSSQQYEIEALETTSKDINRLLKRIFQIEDVKCLNCTLDAFLSQ